MNLRENFLMRSPSTLNELKNYSPMFVVFTDHSFSYDDGYGDRGQSSISTHQQLKPTFLYSEQELQTDRKSVV